MEHVTIAEVADVCARMRGVSLGLFTELGAWVRDEPDGARQRWYATACHRHATHEQWWRHRAPSIPGVESGVDDELTSLLPAEPDVESYRHVLTDLSGGLTDLADRLDPDLDPSTVRVISLVVNDIGQLLDA